MPEMIELEHQAKQSSRVLLFVIANQTRNVSSMIEISYFAGSSLIKGRRLVTYLETYPGPGHHIAEEAISGQGTEFYFYLNRIFSWFKSLNIDPK